MSERLRADIAALAAMTRDSCGTGERASAAWLAGRLREIDGVEDVRVQPYRGTTTYAWENLAHAAAGLFGGRLAAAAALVSLELHMGGRAPWLRRWLPQGEGANVTARVPSRGEPRVTAVLLAHHDAAHTGVMWRRAITHAGAKRRVARRAMDRQGLAFGAALALRALGERRLSRALLAVAAVTQIDVLRSPTVPGADDNATGVAAVLALAERHAAAGGLDGVELLLALTGGEEPGMHGMRAFLREHALDPARTFVLGLDTLGSGTPIVLESEATLLAHHYRAEDVARVPEDVQRWQGGAWTDPILAVQDGLPAVSILSVGPDGVHDQWHVPTDTPERVDLACVERCLAAADAVLAGL